MLSFKRCAGVLVLMCLPVLGACGNKSSSPSPAPHVSVASTPMARGERGAADAVSKMRVAAAPQDGNTTAGVAQEAATSPESGRFIALHHSLTLETQAAQLKATFEAWTKRCIFPECELLSANYARETEGASPSASIEMRIQPRLAEGFIAGLTREAEILAHNRGSEDRTDQVVDVEAQLKNLTQLRDQLRNMMTQRQGSLKDTLDLQRELSNTQARLDSLTGVRKALANETEKVAISIALQARREPLTHQVWEPLREAWNSVGGVTASSMAAIVTFVAAVLPWLVVGLPVLWLLRKLWKRRRKMT